MALEDRKKIFKEIEGLRKERALICFFNFDRKSNPEIPGLQTLFASDTKEALFRVLKESNCKDRGIDLCLYTRGGDVNAVWPLVNLLREFDPDFEVLIPFRAHSGGTLLSLAAKKIVMSPIAELSPIDPTTGNQFNPVDPQNPSKRYGISVEDVVAYVNFVRTHLQLGDEDEKLSKEDGATLHSFISKLTRDVHPLAIGNVHRVHQQIKKLAKTLLACNPAEGKKDDEIVTNLTTRFYSHMHMINRHEASEILGSGKVEFADDRLSGMLDELLRKYEDNFQLRKDFYPLACIGDEMKKEKVRFIGGAIESTAWSYLHETMGTLLQFPLMPENIQIQLPPGQPPPLIPGLPRKYRFNIEAQGWIRNKEPRGITT